MCKMREDIIENLELVQHAIKFNKVTLETAKALSINPDKFSAYVNSLVIKDLLEKKALDNDILNQTLEDIESYYNRMETIDKALFILKIIKSKNMEDLENILEGVYKDTKKTTINRLKRFLDYLGYDKALKEWAKSKVSDIDVDMILNLLGDGAN